MERSDAPGTDHPMPRRLPLALVLVATLCGGCGTLDNIKRPTFPPPKKPEAKVVRIYGGVRGDWGIITEYDWNRTQSYIDYPVIPILAAIDLILDVAGDTVTLPYTAVAELRRATRRPNATTDDPNAPPTTIAPNPTRPLSGPGPIPPPSVSPVPPPDAVPLPGPAPVPSAGSPTAPPLASTPVTGTNR